MIRDGLQVWRSLKTEGGLDVRRGATEDRDGYDRPIELAIRDILFPGAKASLEQRLARTRVSPEPFLAAFFAAVQPYADMMQDVLRMMEAAGAKRGERNLEIAFDFDQASEALKLTLEQFREVERTFRYLTRPMRGRHWNLDGMWSLHRGLAQAVPAAVDWGRRTEVENGSVRAWVGAYQNGRFGSIPVLPLTGDGEMDPLLREIEGLARDYVEVCTAIGPRREDLRAAYNAAVESKKLGMASDEVVQRLYTLFQPDTDHWIEQVILAATNAAEQIRAMPAGERATAARQWVELVRPAIDTLPLEVRTGRALQEELEQFIRLPIWRRRSELYAVWVAAQTAVTAARLFDLEYLASDGVLRFPFSGACLATLSGGKLELWTELRSPLANPSSSKRRNAIQPDYRIIPANSAVPPSERGKGAILVVECKQYRRSSTRNFSEALNDYAAGCPDAKVLLVSYGPIGNAVRDEIRDEHKHRCTTIARLLPRSSESLEAFHKAVYMSLFAWYERTAAEAEREAKAKAERIAAEERAEAARAQAEADAPAVGTITLEWGAGLEDLDLHLLILPRHGGTPEHVCYLRKGAMIAAPFAKLGPDKRQGPAVEVLRVARWLDAVYSVFVHDFSRSGQLGTRGDATVLIGHASGALQRIVCTGLGDAGALWHACRIDGRTGAVEVVDRRLAASEINLDTLSSL